MRKLIGICLIMIMILLMSSISFATKEEEKTLDNPVSAQVTESIEYEGNIDSPYEVAFISNVNQTGASAYENSFTCLPDYGSELKISVKNNNRSGIVIFKVSRGEQDFGYIDVKAGGQVIRSFAMSDGSGISGDWKVYATTRDGHVMDVSVAAGTVK